VGEHDRRGREPADERDGEDVDRAARHGIALREKPGSRHGDEHRGHGRERELEPRLEQRRGSPGQEHEGSPGQEVPPIARTGSEPGQRGERARHSGPDDRGLPADGEHVAGDARKDQELADRPGEPQEPAERVHPARNEGDVLTGDRQEVIQTGGAEVLAHALGQALVLAEHDSEHERSSQPVGPALDRRDDAFPKAIADAPDPAAPSDLPPGRRVDDDVDPLPREPGVFVEALVGASWLPDAHDGLQDRATRRRTTDREHEQDALAHLRASVPAHLCGDADRPARLSSGRRHHELGRGRASDLAGKHASLERLEPERPPPEPDRCERDGERHHPRTVLEDRYRDESCDHENHGHGRLHGNPVRERKAGARRGDEERGPMELERSPHGPSFGP
jgi:hypothetical protein